MAKLSGLHQVEFYAQVSNNIDTRCYRGDAYLAYLALISQADVFDQITNPEGLQRDLYPKHANEVYDYVRREKDTDRPRAFPEVVLNIRDKSVVQIEELESVNDDCPKQYRIRIDISKMQSAKENKVFISRVDGNHRLYHAAGDERREPLLVAVPFQLHIGLSREKERSLFFDINANQKGLNTSHLQITQSKLTPEEQEIKNHLDRWIAKKLANDPESPWHGQIHLGGSKKGSRAQGLTRLVNFVTLETGVNKTLTKSQYIRDLTDPQAQYVLIRSYWKAVKLVFAEEWAYPKDYLLLKNIGVLSLSLLGGTIIDRCVPRGKIGVEDMAFYLRQARSRFDWSSNASPGDRSIAGMSGNKAAMIIAGELAAELSETSGESLMKDLQEQLLKQT